MNWDDHIIKFNLPHARLLYLIYFLSKSNMLEKQQTIKLKEYVILENENIFKLLVTFEQHRSIELLVTDFKRILEEEQEYTFTETEGEDEAESGIRFISKMQLDRHVTLENVNLIFI
jgi:hypothetical protein